MIAKGSFQVTMTAEPTSETLEGRRGTFVEGKHLYELDVELGG
jgi:hypothetical protein